MTDGHIRPIAICAFRKGDRILVVEGHDSSTNVSFFRPLGGGIKFGETSEMALVREIREEIGAGVSNLQYIGTLENIFTFDGAKHHEIVQVYDGQFADAKLYSATHIVGAESTGAPMRILWRSIESFSSQSPLYPDGLLELLRRRPP